MCALLNGKGAGVAKMTNLGLPIPPGFTVTMQVCNWFTDNAAAYPVSLVADVASAMHVIEAAPGALFGDPTAPLLVSVPPAPGPRCRECGHRAQPWLERSHVRGAGDEVC